MTSQYGRLKFSEQKRSRTGVYFRCETCEKQFYVTQARIRQVQKNGNKIRFCSMACYKKDGEKNPFYGGKHTAATLKKLKDHPNRPVFKSGKENPNFVRFGDDFEPKQFYFWRKRLITLNASCERCGYQEFPGVLQLHHKDRDRTNNVRKNIEILCPTCHNVEHYLAEDGIFSQGRLDIWTKK